MSDDTVNSENFPTTQDELNRIIQAALAPKLNKINALEAEKAAAVQERDQVKATVAERDAEISGLKSTVGERERDLLVAKVSHKKNVPAKYLSGDSEEALEAAADEFLSDVRSLGGAPSGGGSEPQGGDQGVQGQGQGVVPSAGTGGEKPPRPTYDEVLKRAYEQAKTH